MVSLILVIQKCLSPEQFELLYEQQLLFELQSPHIFILIPPF